MINYDELAKKFKPAHIRELLIGEAPPPTEKSYFYMPTKPGAGFHFSLPGIVFRHYFGKIPKNIEEYIEFLNQLKDMGVFIIDITNEPLEVSRKIPGEKWPKIVPESIEELKNALPALKKRIEKMGIDERNVTFVLPRQHYLSNIKQLFPDSNIYKSWKSFAENK